MTFLGFTVDEWHIIFVGLLWLGSVPWLMTSYRKVHAPRRILYLFAAPVAALMGALYSVPILAHYGIHVGFNIGLWLRIGIFLLAIGWWTGPYVDRIETKIKEQIVTEGLLEHDE